MSYLNGSEHTPLGWSAGPLEALFPGQVAQCACPQTPSESGLRAGQRWGWGWAPSLPPVLVCGVCPLELGACSELVVMSQPNSHISLLLYRMMLNKTMLFEDLLYFDNIFKPN